MYSNKMLISKILLIFWFNFFNFDLDFNGATYAFFSEFKKEQ